MCIVLYYLELAEIGTKYVCDLKNKFIRVKNLGLHVKYVSFELENHLEMIF